MTGNSQQPDDMMLVAYLDGELDAAGRLRVEAALAADTVVAARLAVLGARNLPFKQAFEPLLHEAPQARLDAMLAGLLEPDAPSRHGVARDPGWGRRHALVAGLALLLTGGLADRLIVAVEQRPVPDAPGHWRDVVARYMQLYTPDTLANIPANDDLLAQELDLVGNRLGLPLRPATVTIDGATLKRSQLLQYDGQPLAQIAYLDPAYGPMALCITRSLAAPEPVETEQRRGMNVAYWSGFGHAFMLIGHNPAAQLSGMAAAIKARLAA